MTPKADNKTDRAKYRVGMVSKMTGLSTHTLRVWERRYAAVVPHRTPAGGRLYTDADVERLRLLHKLVQSGHSIGGIARLADGDLRQMAAAAPAAPPPPDAQHVRQVRERFLDAIEGLRVDEAEQLLSRVALSTEPIEFLELVIGPILVEVGQRWEAGDLRIAHEHACSTVMRSLLFSLMRLYPASSARRCTVVATPKHEQHELGALMVAMLAAMHGRRVLYLGANLPAEEIAYAVAASGADLLLLSVTNLSAEECEAEVATIERAVPPKVGILVGGRAARVPPGSRAQRHQDLRRAEELLAS